MQSRHCQLQLRKPNSWQCQSCILHENCCSWFTWASVVGVFAEAMMAVNVLHVAKATASS